MLHVSKRSLSAEQPPQETATKKAKHDKDVPARLTTWKMLVDSNYAHGRHSEQLRNCRRCKVEFIVSQNFDRACQYQPEAFSGETKQRWMDGAAQDAAREDGTLGEVHYFWTCCGAESLDALGCRYTRHSTWDDPPDSLTYY